MAATVPAQIIELDDYISLADVEVVDINPTLGLFPDAGKAEAVYRALRAAHPHLHVYRATGDAGGVALPRSSADSADRRRRG